MSANKRMGALRMCGTLGLVSLISYSLAVLFAPRAYPGYDWMSQAVSDLSAATAPSRMQWERLSCLYEPCAIVSVMAACVQVSDRRPHDRLLRLAVYLFAAMNWLSIVGYQLFPLTNAGTDLMGFSDIMHLVVTAGVVISSIVSLSCFMLAGTRGQGPRSLSRWAAVALGMMFAGAVGTGLVPPAYFGVAERLSLFAAVGFNAVLGWKLFRSGLCDER